MITSSALGRITIGPGDSPAAVWEQIRALAAGGGLPPLAAARLALAAVELIGSPGGQAAVEVAAVSGEGGAHVQAVVHGGTGRGDGAAARLVDNCRPQVAASGAVGQMIVVTAGQQDSGPSWQDSLSQAAQGGGLTALLAAALIGLDDQARRLAAYHTEIIQLRAELDATSQGLLALHAELSDQRDQLAQAHALAERAGQAKAAFLASMSHEIRSPLNAMIGFTSLLRETALTPEQAEYADTFAAASGHLKDLVNGILDLSRAESGQLELENVPFDLVACIEDAAGIVAPLAEDKGLALAALVAPNVPALVAGDSLRLRQILVNLLSNAVKFTDRGQVTVEVGAQPGAAGDEHRLVFDVRDTGPGIAASALERLFDPFTQADASTARRFGGTGLGLAISKQLTERMGGQLTVASIPGHGATFTAAIPLLHPGPGSPRPDQPLSGVHVLLIHPQPTVVEAARLHLAAWGAAITTASSAASAARRASEWADADLALVGTGRPAGLPTAIRTLTAARRGHPLPVVALTPLIWRPAAPPIPLPWAVTTAPIRRARLREAVLGALGSRDPARDMAPPASSTSAAGTMRVLVPRGLPAAPGGGRPVPGDAATTTVLYIDDNPTLRGLAERILTKDPAITVLTAADAESGLRQAVTHQPSLILLDLQLPGARGETLIRSLRAEERTSGIPIIVVSGDTSPATVKHLTSLGATAHLAKPFDAEHLRAAVASAAQGRSPAAPAIAGPT